MKMYKAELQDALFLFLSLNSLIKHAPDFMTPSQVRDASGHHGRTADFIDPADKKYTVRLTIEVFRNGAPDTEYINETQPMPKAESPAILMEKANA